MDWKKIKVDTWFIGAIVLYLLSMIAALGTIGRVLFWVAIFFELTGLVLLLRSPESRKSVKSWVLFIVALVLYFVSQSVSIG